MARYSIVKRQRKYYKYGTEPIHIDLSKSDNTSNLTDGNFVVNQVYSWSATRVYNLTSDKSANKLFVHAFSDWIQANCSWTFTITAITDQGEQELLTKDYGYGKTFNETFEYDLTGVTKIKGIKIYAKCYARYTEYSYGSIKLSFSSNESAESTEEDYDYYIDRNKLHNLARRRRDYYKYGTEPNVTVVGSPTIVDGVASGFTTANYLTLPSKPVVDKNPWEMVLKVTTDSSLANQGLIGVSSDGILRIQIQSKKLEVHLSTSTSSFNIVSALTSRALTANTTYWFKIEFTGSAYNLYLSTDGSVYDLEATKATSTAFVFPTTTFIGRHRDTAWKGSIDLSKSYIKINGQDWWRGTRVVKSTEDDHEWYVDRNVAYDLVYKTHEVISQTFNVSDELQTYVVPEGVNKVSVVCTASRGTGNAGAGGSVKCDLSVTEGQTLYVMVGASPTTVNTPVYNASDIRINGTEYENRIIVAGGGGTGTGTTSGNLYHDKGGAGGGLIGGDAKAVAYQKGGFGGTQEAGGAASYRSGGDTDGWVAGAAGTLGMGGKGAKGSMYGGTVLGGAGGAGYYGGGGGGVYDIDSVGISFAGGGGGSSYTDDTLCENVVHLQGINNGEGYVKISYIKELRK